MSCPIHDRCACCSSSLQYATSITTGSSQFAPQPGNIVFGYEWAAPLVATSGGQWHTTVDPVTFHPSSTLYSGQDLSQPDYYRSRTSFETMPHHHAYHRETRAHLHEQKQAFPSREQVRIVVVQRIFSGLMLFQFAMQPPYMPYVQGVNRMAIPNSFSGQALPALHLHRGGMSSFASQEELSQTMPAIDSSQSILFDEPPPPYTNNYSLGDAYPQPAVLSSDRLLNVGQMTHPPLAPVPLRHSSLYQVLKHESPASPLTGTIHSRVSSLAHALEPQDPQARQAPRPGHGDRLGSYGISAPSPNMTTSLNLTAAPGDLCSNLVQVPRLTLHAPAQTQQALVSAETSPTAARANPPAQNLSAVAPLHAHTLAHALPEATNQDYDTLPRLRKVSV